MEGSRRKARADCHRVLLPVPRRLVRVMLEESLTAFVCCSLVLGRRRLLLHAPPSLQGPGKAMSEAGRERAWRTLGGWSLRLVLLGFLSTPLGSSTVTHFHSS